MTDLVLDHLMIRARDWKASRAAFMRLGFLMTPLRPNKPMGGDTGKAGSQLALFDSPDDRCLNYFELSSFNPTSAHPMMTEILGGVDGGAMLVHRTGDVDQVRQRWSEAGISSPDPWRISFPTTGSVIGDSFDILFASPASSPIFVNAVRSENLDAYRAREWRDHPNGARSWTKTLIVAPGDTFRPTIEFFKTLLVDAVEDEGEEWSRFRTGPVCMNVVARTEWPGLEMRTEPFIAGVELSVGDIDVVQKLLAASEIDAVHHNGGVHVGARDGAGLCFRFIQAERDSR